MPPRARHSACSGVLRGIMSMDAIIGIRFCNRSWYIISACSATALVADLFFRIDWILTNKLYWCSSVLFRLVVHVSSLRMYINRPIIDIVIKVSKTSMMVVCMTVSLGFAVFEI